jgi:hypothetical protein
MPAEKVRLKDGVLPHLKIREWEFQKPQNGLVLLKHPKIKYTLGVKEDDIEWDSPNGG